MKRLLSLLVGVFLLGSRGFAQDIGVRAIGGAAGLVSVSNGIGSGPMLSGHVNLGEVVKSVWLEPDFSYWSVSRDVRELSITNRDFSINANLKYTPGRRADLRPYFGAGVGYQSMRSEATHPAFGMVSETDGDLGINFLGGADYKIGDKYRAFVEARYTLVSDLNHFLVRGGVSYWLKR